jgi:hypothetical protein
MRRLSIGGAAAIVVLVLWLCRWEIYPLPRADAPGGAYALDRWTGRMYFMRLNEMEPMQR